MLKCIFFDAAGTLIHLPKGVGFHYRAVAGRFGFWPDEQAVNRAFRTVFQRTPAPATTRLPRPDDDRAWWQRIVYGVLEELHAPVTLDRAAYFPAVFQEFTQPGVWALYPEVESVLRDLAPRFRLAIVSNFDGRLRAILEGLGVLHFFDPVVVSSEVGADKPDPWIFQQALALTGTTPGEVLHVGDDPECDWAAAARLGLATFQLDRPRNSLTELLEQLSPSDPHL